MKQVVKAYMTKEKNTLFIKEMPWLKAHKTFMDPLQR